MYIKRINTLVFLIVASMLATISVMGGANQKVDEPNGSGTWAAGPDFPAPAVVRAVGVYFPANGKFYAMGGRMSDTAGNNLHNPAEYDPATNTWTVKAATIAGDDVNNMACGVLTSGGTPLIYCVGGSAGGGTTAASRVFTYNPVTDTIAVLPATEDWPGNSAGNILPGGFAVLNNKLYTIGAFMITPATMLGDVWEYDPALAAGSRWTLKSGLPVEHGYVPTTVINGMIYTAGGSVISGTTLADSADSYVYDPVADNWTQIADIPRATGETRAVTINGEMWVLGGGRVAPNPSNEVDIYNPTTNTWRLGPAFMSPRRNFPADTDGTHIWIAGGYDAAVLQNTMEIFTLAGGTPTATATNTPTDTPTATSTPTATATVAATPTDTATATSTPTATATTAATPTDTATATSTPTATATVDVTPTDTATPTATATVGVTPSNTPTDTPTATATSTASASPTASCTPADIINDGGFETGGIPSTIWNNPQNSTNFGTPLCTVQFCGDGGIGSPPPHSGDVWAWFGGATAIEMSALGQDVVIPAGSTVRLHFFMWISAVSSPYTDVLNVKVDNVTVQSYAEPIVAETGYTERVIDLDAYADGASHNIQFEYNGPTTGTANFWVDDVSLIASGACGTPSGTPTSTPTNTPTATATATSTPTSTPTGSPTPLGVFRNPAPICMTLGNPADLYPSTITVAGGPVQIGNMRITFFDFYHVLPDNVDALLVGPGGQKYVLMGDAGGAIPIDPAAPVTLTFADFVGVVLPDSAALTTGTYEPTNWESPVTSFPAPAPPAPYIEHGSVPMPPIGQTMFGNFGFTNANGIWSLYVRDDAGTFVQQAITGCINGGWQIEFLPLTAAHATISGRVTTADNRGIRNAKVVVTGETLQEPIIATTGSFGYYTVDGLTAGQTYVVTVNSKRYTFSVPSRAITLVDNLTDVNFVAEPQD